MHIDPLERKWIFVVFAMVGIMLIAIFFTALVQRVHPPSNVETIDSASLHLTQEFAEDNLGVHRGADAAVRVTMVAARYGFYPQHIEVPAGTPVTFRWATIDVLHGVHMARTNMNTMVVPGFVSQVTTVFPEPGEYPMFCNEYCGLGHDHMWSRVTVVPKDQWSGPKVATVAADKKGG